ncbi:MAG: hypothetical protein NZ473_03945 [Candidatus Kapabacteria bacterium]|nr:hypothetical protein [Candidatus Kapabacteria bacterium]MCS7169012.1 hypothetical protein [Candidatus Kapabacteria bacterium]MDW7997128.1 hypothetical protein [Bacteroidota bacterium]MDW8225691.1 hypothetical protein [Bacteroidota bacterium]
MHLLGRWLVIVLGIVSITSASGQQVRQDRSAPPEKRWDRWIEHLRGYLDLSTYQQEQLRTLLRERWEQSQRERELFRQRLREILTPSQWEKLQQLRRERHKRFRKHLREHPNNDGLPYR